ncbi:MAG: nuclear transport factor 2 family protein [Gemmatimonadaceae bacterium]|nr:nuclear transport factor 2 family protein [Gemmatimonadaceae bacterium]
MRHTHAYAIWHDARTRLTNHPNDIRDDWPFSGRGHHAAARMIPTRDARRDSIVALRRRPLTENWMSSDQTTVDQQIRLAKAYFAKVDAGDETLLDMFTEDVQAYFPKIGTTRGKADLVHLVQTLTSVVGRFEHDPSRMVFTHQGTRLVVEGFEAGQYADGTPFPAGAKSEGRYCNVFEFTGTLINRLHIHADPDLAGQFDGRFAPSVPRVPGNAKSNVMNMREDFASESDLTTTNTEDGAWHTNLNTKSRSSPAEPRASDSPPQSASSRKGHGCL